MFFSVFYGWTNDDDDDDDGDNDDDDDDDDWWNTHLYQATVVWRVIFKLNRLKEHIIIFRSWFL